MQYETTVVSSFGSALPELYCRTKGALFLNSFHLPAVCAGDFAANTESEAVASELGVSV